MKEIVTNQKVECNRETVKVNVRVTEIKDFTLALIEFVGGKPPFEFPKRYEKYFNHHQTGYAVKIKNSKIERINLLVESYNYSKTGGVFSESPEGLFVKSVLSKYTDLIKE